MQPIRLMKSDKNLQNTSQKRAVSLGSGNVHESLYQNRQKRSTKAVP